MQFIAMAPALTSDGALDNKRTHAGHLSETSEKKLKWTAKTDKSDYIVRNDTGRSNKIKDSCFLIKNSPLNSTVDRNILRVSKKMNPENGRSSKDTANNPTIIDVNLKHTRKKAMCGKDKPPGSFNKVPQMSNGDNKMFIKPPEVVATSTECAKPSLNSQLPSVASTSSDCTTSFDSAVARHARLTRRAAKLENRVRRLQARQAISHTRQQIGGFVDQQKRLIEQQVVQKESPDAALDLKDAQNMSTSALVHLVQKWQAQQPLSRRHSKQDGSSIVKLDVEMCAELDQLSGHLSSNLHQLESAVDSDATESSSGGESCDEGEFDYDWGEKTKPTLQKRVDWRWAKDRCDIASRWTWLQAQVSDLEYRIRQQSEIYRQIRQKKGEVKLGESSSSTSSVGRDTRLELLQQSNMSPAAVTPLLSNLDTQSASLKKQLGNIYTPSPKQSHLLAGVTTRDAESATPNGIVPQAVRSSLSSVCSSADNTPALTVGFESTSLQTILDPTTVAARCRPTILGKYRKRKLLRTSSLTRNRKCARLSTVKCQCYPPATPCVMCGGRYNNVKDGHQENSPVPEKIALMDHSYHQVLSLEDDVSLSLHFASLLKTGEWQQRLQSKSRAGQFGVEKRRGQYQIKEKQKFAKKTASLEVLSRIKNKYAAERVYSALPLSPEKKRLSRICGIRVRKKKAALHGALRKERKLVMSGARSRSGVMYGNESSTLREIKEHIRRKRAESAYDINNIVIPYSIAASTRVEKLQYKEILTPSWREIGNPKSPTAKARRRSTSCDKPVRDSSRETIVAPPVIQEKDESHPDDDEFEDVCEEAVRARHDRSEHEEKQKFLSYTSTTSQQHKRQRGRPSESTPTSIGVMTPDPSSPDVSDGHTRATPPAVSHTLPSVISQTSLHVLEDSNKCETVSRRRASSMSSTLSRSDRFRSCSGDSHIGWVPRRFPLNDGEYNQLFMERPPDVKYSLRASRAVHVPRTSVSKEVLMYEDSYALDSPPQSPSSSSASTELDDDKEWTVKSVNSRHSGLILKIAKR